MNLPKAKLNPDKLGEVEAMLSAAWAYRDERRAEELQQELEAEELSYTSAFMLEFRKRRGDPNQPIHFEFYGLSFMTGTKMLSDEEVGLMGILMASKGYSLTNITDVQGQTLFFAALIFVGTTQHDDENLPRFSSYDETIEWIQEPGMASIVNALRAALLDRNIFVKKKFLPNLLPENQNEENE